MSRAGSNPAPGLKQLQKGTNHAFSILAAAVAALSINTASAQQPRPMPYSIVCGGTELFIDTVAKKHREVPVGRGFARNGQILVQVWASESGSFTVTMTPAGRGVICVMTAGEEWETIEPKKGDPS